MKYVKFLMIFSLLAIIVPNLVSADTASDIQTQIQALLQQLKELQEQLAAIQQTTAVWCYDFNVNIGINSFSPRSDIDPRSEIEALQTALGKEGFDIGEDEKGNFGESTASAVSGLQQKYVDEILSPLGLKYGTGYLGKATRAKLNSLYGCGVKPLPTITPIPVPACNVFLTCETGYTPFNTSEKDSQGCPIIKCISGPTPVPIPSIPIPSVSEQVKCLFHESKSIQECYSSAGVGCKDISACVADVKGVKGEQITWKSTCGGYAYTTMDGQNEYAEFKCAASAISTPTPIPTSTTTQTPIPTTPQTPTISPITPIAVPTTPTAFTPTITVASPNGGETWQIGSTQTVKWTSTNIPGTHLIITMRLRDSAGVEHNLWSYTQNDGFKTIVVPSNLVPGSYRLELKSIVDNQTVFDSSDAAFSIVAASTPTTPSSITVLPSTGNQPPTITEVTGPNTLRMYENGTWTVKASDPEQGVLTYSVSWGDSQQTFSGYNPTTYIQTATFNYIYDYTGTYQLTFTVTDNKGLSAKTSISVNVGEVPPPSITILSPNGGEVFKLGSTYNIVWKSSNVTRIVLDLVDSTGKFFILKNLVNVSGNPGSASWTIPTYTELGQYRMRVGTCSSSVTNCTTTGAEDPVTIYDISDAAFSIVSIIY